MLVSKGWVSRYSTWVQYSIQGTGLERDGKEAGGHPSSLPRLCCLRLRYVRTSSHPC